LEANKLIQLLEHLHGLHRQAFLLFPLLLLAAAVVLQVTVVASHLRPELAVVGVAHLPTQIIYL
jgi:hypothetical protein